MTLICNEFADAIINGDLDKILSLAPKGTSLSFYFRGEYKVKSKQQLNPLPYIKNPTPLVLCILCEQVEILDLFLTQYKCDLFQYVGDWTPIHFACCIKSYECLERLLKIREFTKYIDIPIKESINADNDHATTALHVATTNKRYHQVILLTQELIESKTTNEIELLNGHIPSTSYIDRRSLSGNTALHIAVYQNDIEMCKILLSADADINTRNDDGVTPLQMAKELNNTEIVSVLVNNLCYSFDMLISKYFTQEFIQKHHLEVQIPPEMQLKQQINDLTSQVIELSTQVTNLENK